VRRGGINLGATIPKCDFLKKTRFIALKLLFTILQIIKKPVKNPLQTLFFTKPKIAWAP
jgi:hypothetical protein